MNRLNRSLSKAVLAAAVLSVFAPAGMAQYRVDRSGATDANRRLGSDGHNDVDKRPQSWDIQNNIVYGNVTGGKQFRGNVTSDPFAVRQNTGSETFDNFVRSSSGVTTGGVPTYNASQTRAYYGDSRGVAPPAGTVGVTTSGGYTPPVPTAWNTIDPRQQTIGTVTTVSRPGEFGQVGPVDGLYAPDATAVPPLTPGSPLNGGLSDYTNLNSQTVAQLTPAQIKQMQSDTNVSQVPGQTPANGNNPVEAGQQPLQTTGTPNNNGPLNQPGQTNNTPAVQPNYGMVTSPAGQPIGGAAPVNGGATALDNSVRPDTVDNTAGPADMGLVTRIRPQVGEKPDQPTNTAVGLPNNQPQRPGQTAEDSARDYNAALRKQQAAKTGDQADKTAPADKTAKPDAATGDKTSPARWPAVPRLIPRA